MPRNEAVASLAHTSAPNQLEEVKVVQPRLKQKVVHSEHRPSTRSCPAAAAACAGGAAAAAAAGRSGRCQGQRATGSTTQHLQWQCSGLNTCLRCQCSAAVNVVVPDPSLLPCNHPKLVCTL